MDSGELIPWFEMVVPSLVKVDDISNFKIDESESQGFRWISLDDQLVEKGLGLKRDLVLLGMI